MKIIAGLGNPGRGYENTRHNAGFDAIDRLAFKYEIPLNEVKHKSICGSGFMGNERVLLMKPQTYMNRSGEAIAKALHYYKLKPSDLIVVFDDVNLMPGQIRVRLRGSSGGHNGMRSIIYCISGNVFARVKIGIGKEDGKTLSGYVLGKFTRAESVLLDEAYSNAVSAIELLISGEADRAMNVFNKKVKAGEKEDL
ncbi:peptidyl-tRNA hydrolase [Johnsonella ignava ATCC 51276]|uniref:Peptidyl-tRNA hydrolase n=1 Tax=Johnsonella ignava ATCC 51276 TaxID=679200 RepID=G5GFY8_9FIRM|nr:aminoacyl-tRNA hydrolase [Johnsonella ignava]EHI56412.1 peptidyl-tRNA hydrolase [Johnsonella ignava ATCC 51276]